MSVIDLRAETRAYGRARLRELAIDAARDVVLDGGWAAVRMGAVAATIGISRQSLHAEFGTKDELGNALVMREVSMFFEAVQGLLGEHPGDLAGGVVAAAEYMLTAARSNPLLQTILTRTPADGDVSLLQLLTTRGEALIENAMRIFGTWVDEQWPEAHPGDVRVVVESVVRLVLSHALTFSKEPSDAAQDIAQVACRCMRFPDP